MKRLLWIDTSPDRYDLAADPVPTDGARQEFCGEVLTTNAYKMLFRDGRGFKLWGSVPSGISNVSRGDRVSFVARVEASAADPKFGFFSRPTKAQYIEEC